MTTALNKLDPAWAWAPFAPDRKNPWDHAAAAHLYRRAGFGANWQQLETAATDGLEKTLDRVFKPGSVKTPKAGGGFSADPERFNKEMFTFGQTMMATGDSRKLSSWWLFRMLNTPDQLTEKATLFWHGHFATSAAKVDNAELMLKHSAKLREHALSEFEPLVQAMSKDPAMLIWLDAAVNRKVRPNENYARELMELFCLGVGNYSEKDIKELARTFTGWEVNRKRFRFDKYQHDTGIKTFLGRSGNFGGEEAVRVVLDQPAAPLFIARKLAKYFVSEEPALPDTLIEPIAKQLRSNGFHVGKVVRTMLSSNLFFSDHARGHIVRSPVMLGVGLLRPLEGRTNINILTQGLEQLGQGVFFPPNVKGWDGGRTWINSSTLLGRANLVRRILNNKESQFANGDLAGLAKRYDIKGGKQIVEWLSALLLSRPIPAAAQRTLVEIASNSGDVDQNLRETIHAISTLPEFHLV